MHDDDEYLSEDLAVVAHGLSFFELFFGFMLQLHVRFPEKAMRKITAACPHISSSSSCEGMMEKDPARWAVICLTCPARHHGLQPRPRRCRNEQPAATAALAVCLPISGSCMADNRLLSSRLSRMNDRANPSRLDCLTSNAFDAHC
jgi:hypothetical protein